jgi:prepilin-type N-terminal cleavage/methylation domain-containing protein
MIGYHKLLRHCSYIIVYMFCQNTHKKAQRITFGFTLVELMVATALFAVVMTVATSTLLALIDANRKAQALQSVVNNLNIAIDGMVRNMRMGTNYHCGPGILTETRDCQTGGTLVAFEPYNGSSEQTNDQWVYWHDSNTKQLYRATDGTTNGFAITSPEVQIDEMKFYVVGSSRADALQSKIIITVKGVAGIDERTQTKFNIQAMASQRILDI